MKNSQLFATLTKEDRQFLNEDADIKTFEKGEIIFSPLDKCEYLSIIVEGQVKLCKYTMDGKEQILSFLGPDDVFGEAIVFEEEYYPVTVIVEKKCKIMMIHRESLLILTQRNKDFTAAFFGELTSKIKLLNNKIEMLSLKSIKQKIARYLLNLKETQQNENVTLPYSKQKIAFLLSTSREVISRNFSEMEEDGYIKQIDKDILYINEDMLEELLIS